MRQLVSHCLTTLLFGACAGSLSAQDLDCKHRTISLIALDNSGATVVGISALDLRAKLHNDDPQITSVRQDRRPHKIVVLVDISSSMSGESGGREARMSWDLVSHVVLSQLPNTSLALLTFDDAVRDRVDFSPENQMIVKYLAQRQKAPSATKPKQKTAVYDSILAAAAMLHSPDSTNSILLISDGQDNSSKAHATDTARELASQGVALHAILLTPESLRQRSSFSVEEAQANDAIRSLIGDTGGLVYGPLGRILPGANSGMVEGISYDLSDSEKKELAEGLAKFYSSILNDQLAELQISSPDKKWRTLTLSFSKEKSSASKGLSLAYPRQFPACP